MIYPFSGLLYLTLEFALANAGLITHGGICSFLGVILIRYAPYILVLRVRYVCYTLPGFSEVVCSRFEFARHFESYLSRPPPFYMRMRTTISDEHSIVTMLRSTRIIFSTYSFSQHVRIHHLRNNYVPDRYNRF